jgi:hypothetical protein
MFRSAWVIALLLAVGGGSRAIAATFTKLPPKDGKTIAALAGEIKDGDAEGLKLLIKTENDLGHLIYAIRLNSPGGSLLEGTNLAEIIRQARISTSVLSGSQCASACFIAFAAGTDKFANYGALIGVHGASDKSGRESGTATVSMARIVKELGVPAGIIGKMVVTPPDQIVWLSPDDLRSMGTTMTGKPTQIPPTATSEPQLPLLPQAPSAQAKKSPTWDEFVSKAIDVSSKQHNGRPAYKRVCQPELKSCVNAIFLKLNDGKDLIVKKTEDISGKTISREMCEFNSHGDIRLCVDWDTGETHRDMQDSNGAWSKVADE